MRYVGEYVFPTCLSAVIEPIWFESMTNEEMLKATLLTATEMIKESRSDEFTSEDRSIIMKAYVKETSQKYPKKKVLAELAEFFPLMKPHLGVKAKRANKPTSVGAAKKSVKSAKTAAKPAKKAAAKPAKKPYALPSDSDEFCEEICEMIFGAKLGLFP
jgi:hypothetical protein